MNGRRWLGLLLIVAGVALLAYGAWRVVGNGAGTSPDSSAGASASQSAASQVPSPTTEVPATATPVPPTATPVPPLGEADVRAFVDQLVVAVQTGDLETLVAALHPATLNRYGEAACRAHLATFVDPTFGIEVTEVQAPAAWDYTTDGLTTSIPDAWAVPGTRTQGGVPVALTFHFAPWDGTVRWFTDCTPSPGG